MSYGGQITAERSLTSDLLTVDGDITFTAVDTFSMVIEEERGGGANDLYR